METQAILDPVMVDGAGEGRELRADLPHAVLEAALGLLLSELMGDGHHQGLGHSGVSPKAACSFM
jgi:hypothetical protein